MANYRCQTQQSDTQITAEIMQTYDLLGVVFGLYFIHHQDIFWGVFRDSSLIPLFVGFAVNRSQKTNNPTHKSALELFTIDRLHNNNFAAK